MFRKIFGFLAFVLIFAGCKEDKQDKKTVPLKFQKESIIKKAGVHCDTAEYDCSVITLDVIRASGASEVSAEINRNLDEHLIKLITSEEDTGVKNLDELSEKFLNEYRQASESFEEEPPWEAYVNENIYLRNEAIVSIGITTEIFSGGAHGYKTLTFVNFNPETGEVYTPGDIFTEDFLSFVEQRFRQEQDIPENDNINSTGFWFEDDEFRLPENIGFSEEKVILVYNSYEIAPYAAGDIVMEISIEEAQPFMKIR